VNRPKILRLKAQGTRVVKAGDFEPDADVQILTRRRAGDARQGRRARDGGLRRARARVSVRREARARGAAINAILLGHGLLAIKRVNFHVDPLAGAETPDGEPASALHARGVTNGSVTPQAGGGRGLAHPADHFNLLTDFPETTPQEEDAERAEGGPAPSSTTLFRNVDDGWSCRCGRPTR